MILNLWFVLSFSHILLSYWSLGILLSVRSIFLICAIVACDWTTIQYCLQILLILLLIKFKLFFVIYLLQVCDFFILIFCISSRCWELLIYLSTSHLQILYLLWKTFLINHFKCWVSTHVIYTPIHVFMIIFHFWVVHITIICIHILFFSV